MLRRIYAAYLILYLSYYSKNYTINLIKRLAARNLRRPLVVRILRFIQQLTNADVSEHRKVINTICGGYVYRTARI